MEFRFALLGIPVAVNPWFFLLALVLAAQRPGPELAVFVAVAFVSILAHELGHALAYRAYGFRPRIAISGLINSTVAQGERPLVPREHLLMTLAGPAVTLSMAGVAYGVRHAVDLPPGLVAVAARDFMWVNLFWGAFNLLPMLPMDGGQALLALTRMITKKNALRPALAVSLVVGALLTGLAALLDSWFNAALLLVMTLQNLARWKDAGVSEALEEARARLKSAAALVDRGAATVAEAEVRAVLSRGALDDETKALAAHVLARALLVQDKAAAAVAALEEMPEGVGADPVLLGSALRRAGEALRAVRVLEDAFKKRPTGRVAREYALSLVDAGQWPILKDVLGSEAALKFTDDVCAGFAAALFDTGHVEEALGVQGFRYQRQPTADAAHQAARACARLGRVDDALTWLRHAVTAGFRDVGRIEQDEVLAPVRTAEAWNDVRASMGA